MLDEYQSILLTGGAGFIGGHLTEKLLSLGKDVVLLDNFSTAYTHSIRERASVVKADIRDKNRVQEVMEGVDLVFHLAANSNGSLSVKDTRFDFEVNVGGTFNILEAADEGNISKVVFISSASVYGTPQYFPINEDHPKKPFVPYGAHKYVGELLCGSFFHAHNLPVVIGRPFCVYGPRENPHHALVEPSRYLRWHLNNKPIQVVGNPDKKTRDFVHVSDIVNALLILAEKGALGEAYNLGSGREYSMTYLTQVIGEVTGTPADLSILPNITDDTYRLVGDISKLRNLGYKPRMELEEGVKLLAKDLGHDPELPTGETIFKKDQKGEHIHSESVPP